MKQIAPSALFIRSPSGFERFGLRSASVGAKRMSTGHPAPSRGRSKAPENMLKWHVPGAFFSRKPSCDDSGKRKSRFLPRTVFRIFGDRIAIKKQKLLKK